MKGEMGSKEGDEADTHGFVSSFQLRKEDICHFS